MPARIFAMARMDAARPALTPHEIPADVFADIPLSILHGDDDLIVCQPADAPPMPVGRDGDAVVAAIGSWSRPGAAPPAGVEHLVGLYRRHGAGAITHTDGAVALLVKEGAVTTVIQDRNAGVICMYWLEADGVLMISDRIAPLLAARPEAASRLDHGALQEYLCRTYIGAPRTIYRDIRRLGPGQVLRSDGTGVQPGAVDDWRRSSDGPADDAVAVRQYRQALADAIGDAMSVPGRTGFLLSGGMDSSVNVALGAERSDTPLVTLGIAAEKYNTDAPFARRVAELYGTDHREHMIRGAEIEELPRMVAALEQPFCEPGMILTWCALKLSKEHCDSVIGGEAADQLFTGCPTGSFGRLAARRRWGPLLGPAVSAARGVFRGPFYGNVFMRKVENRLFAGHDLTNWCGRYGFRDCDMVELLRRPQSGSDVYADVAVPDHDREALLDFGCSVLARNYALDGILAPTAAFADHLGVATSSPFLSRPVADLILSLPWPLRLVETESGTPRFIAKRLHRLLACELLPQDIVDRPKQGGAVNPLIHFENADRQALVRRALVASPLIDRLCRPEAVAALFAEVTRNSTRIMQLVVLDLWHRIFVEGDTELAQTPLTEALRQRAAGN
jgi:asparagine synthase (glutamine-hydrolysing)